jgi:hypothetical protein
MFRRSRYGHHAPLSAFVCACAVLLYAAAPAAQRAAQTNASILPIRRVVLYKAGVGYFEHLARVVGSGQLTMQFTSRQLDDVLNSLTALDLDDGRVVGISYDSTAPLEQRLGSLGLQLPAGADRAQFYSALRGVRVDVTQGQSRAVGRLLGVERQTRTGPGAIVAAEVDELTVVTDDGRVRTFELGPGVSVQIADPQLRQDVASYMALVGASRRQDLRQVTISTSGAGTRRLLVSYISEVPVWKATYRLVFPAETPKSPLLQGWAIIDNTTADDWTNVDLSLVAGAPQSFVQSISQPYYTERPIVPLPRTALVRPQVHEPTIASLEESVTVSGASPVVDRVGIQGNGGRGGGAGAGAAAQTANRGGFAAPPQAPAAVGQPLADLFEYHIQDPVTIRRNQSALVPILSESVEAERVSIWRPLLPDNRPLRGLWLNNSTGLTLDGGTLSIVDGGAFAGEALMETLKPAERRLISYGTDLGLVVSAKNDPVINKITRVAAHDGIVVTTEEDRSRWVYTLRNADTTPRTLVIEHPLRAGWTIDPVPGMVENTAGLVRFRLTLDAKAETTFTVMEHRPTGTRISVGDIDEGRIAGWALRGIADSGVRRAIQPIVAKRQEIAVVESQLRSLDGQITGITSDEQRLRENMQALGPSKDERALRQKYTKTLDGNEDRLAALQADFKRVSADRDAKQAELSGLIATVTFELLGE